MGTGRTIATGAVVGAFMLGLHYLAGRAWEAWVGFDTPAKLAGLGAVHLVLGGGAAVGSLASKRAGIPNDVGNAAAATAVGMGLANGVGLEALALRLWSARRTASTALERT